MQLNVQWARGLILGLLTFLTLTVWLPLLPTVGGNGALAFLAGSTPSHELVVSFLNVGQGDAIFIETPDGVQVLVDGGPDSAVLRELGKVMGVGDRDIDVVVATHSDKDHVGGLSDVLQRYTVHHIIRTENLNDTTVAQAFERAVAAEGAVVTYARAGQVWQLGASTTLVIYSPASDPREWESNAASIVVQLRYGDIEFLLTGDAPIGTEQYLSGRYGTELESEVLKLGHHGSRTSTSEELLAVVSPLYAVVSAGSDNSYGHPHAEVVERVHAQGAALVSTADGKSVTFRTDGKRVWQE